MLAAGRLPTMAGVNVRPACVDDAPGLCALCTELAEGRPEALPASAPRTREVLTRILRQPNRSLLVADLDGHLAGTVDLLIVDNLTHGGRPWAVVENVVVREALRRQGVATALMAEAIRQAQAANCYKLQLISGKQRTWAHAFYRTLGMEAVGAGFKVYFE